jgi:hypothetical protein
MARFGMVASVAGGAAEPQEMDLTAFTPAGYAAFSQLEVYNPDSLYEKINGKAPLYTDAGFEKLYTRRFAGQSDPNLAMELYLYDMGQAKNAFSVYSLQKRPDGEAVAEIAMAYKTSNGLYLIQGRYYVEVVGFVTSAELSAAMAEMGKRLCQGLAAEGGEIAELKLLSDEKLITGSIKLYTESAFGLDTFGNVFAGSFQLGGDTVTGFVSQRADAADAEKMAKEYYKFLLDNGANAIKPQNAGLNVMMADFYGAVEIVFAQDTFVAGIHEAEAQGSAEELAKILINKLSEVGK